MPYKDKETQKKAQREWVRQKRDKGGKELTLEVAKLNWRNGYPVR